MGRFIGNIVYALLWAILFLPPRLLTLLALMWLGVVLWLHRNRHNRHGVTGAEAAVSILAGRKLKTKVVAVEDTLADCYLPQMDTVVLSKRTFSGTSIGAVSIAAHEAGHALQRKRWFVPWIARRLLAWPAGLGVALCLWTWGIGMILEDQRVLLAAAGCFSLYMLFLLFELVCEIDASRRGVLELIRHGILDAAESRVARRILRSAFVTYIAFFAGSLLGLGFFLSSLDWHVLIDQLPPGAVEQFQAMLPNG